MFGSLWDANVSLLDKIASDAFACDAAHSLSSPAVLFAAVCTYIILGDSGLAVALMLKLRIRRIRRQDQK